MIWDELNQGSDKNRSEMGHLSSDGEKLTIARSYFLHGMRFFGVCVV